MIAMLYVVLLFSTRLWNKQNPGGWMGPLQIIKSNPSAQAGLPGLCPVEFRGSQRTESPQPLWATCASVWPPSQ